MKQNPLTHSLVTETLFNVTLGERVVDGWKGCGWVGGLWMGGREGGLLMGGRLEIVHRVKDI